MDFDKKILVLKQIADGFSITGKAISGIFRLEIENGVATYSISVINLSAVEGGSFYLFFMDDNRALYTFDLGKRPFSQTKSLMNCPSIRNGLSVGISFIKDDLPTLVAFARENKDSADVVELKKAIADKCFLDRKKYREKPVPPPENPPQAYNDEVVATENYYLNDKEMTEKLKIIAGFDDEYLRNQVGEGNFTGEKEAGKERESGTCFQDEANRGRSKDGFDEAPYYLTAKPELDALFEKFPAEEDLSRAVADSKWIRVYYSQDRYYVVGVVKEKGVEKYICYGVPAKYSPDPPDELKGFCSFIPLSVFDLKGDGYWMMFQDAITGNCVKK